MPGTTCSTGVYSSGVWLLPSRLGTNSIAEGKRGARISASWPAPLGMTRWRRPSDWIDASISARISRLQRDRVVVGDDLDLDVEVALAGDGRG